MGKKTVVWRGMGKQTVVRCLWKMILNIWPKSYLSSHYNQTFSKWIWLKISILSLDLWLRKFLFVDQELRCLSHISKLSIARIPKSNLLASLTSCQRKAHQVSCGAKRVIPPQRCNRYVPSQCFFLICNTDYEFVKQNSGGAQEHLVW